MHRAFKPSAFQGADFAAVLSTQRVAAFYPAGIAETTLQGFFWWTGFHYLKERLYYPVKLNFHHIKLSQGEPRIGAFMVFGFFC